MTNPLAEHIEDQVTDEKLEELWQGIDARRSEYQDTSQRRGVAVYATGFAVAAAIALGWVWGTPSAQLETASVPQVQQQPPAPSWEAGAALRTANEKMSVDLEDGSKVILAPQSRVAMQETNSEDVALALQEGRVKCSVAKDKQRTFSVLAGSVTVRVVGTEFSVERTMLEVGEMVSVDVTEGIVEVEGPDGVHKRLAMGESWSVKIGQEASEDTQSAMEPSSTRAKKGASAINSTSKKKSEDLFAAARQKRNTGDAAGAARLYQQFLAAASGDPRSGLAALELGRLKMDQLGDVAGAVGPLSRAARGAGSLGDDALARLVRAHAQLGQVAACKSARSRYLKAYPSGVHVERVRSLCR